MAQAAKHLRKNKDLEALAEQERKEKEEEKSKKRSRSREKKRKAHVVHRWLIDQDNSVSSELPDGQGVWHYDETCTHNIKRVHGQKKHHNGNMAYMLL
nr:ankyrin 1, erythrocytic a isoform X25 [Danio rerio]|eukprot:XP_021331796.1 ankyrin 1, erythrocytic a isoform X25 [Danio rerio]